MINVSRAQLAEMIYESAMWKLHQCENLQIVREIWDAIEIETPRMEPKKDKTIKSVKVGYER